MVISDCSTSVTLLFAIKLLKIQISQVENVSNVNLELVAITLQQLNDELQNSSLISNSLKFGIIERLHSTLSQISNPIIMPCALQILANIAIDFHGAFKIIGNDELLKILIELMYAQKDLRKCCGEVFFHLSLNEFGEFETFKFFKDLFKVQNFKAF